MEGSGFLIIPLLAFIFILNTWIDNAADNMDKICHRIDTIQENSIIPKPRLSLLMECSISGDSHENCLKKFPENTNAENINRELFAIKELCKAPFQ